MAQLPQMHSHRLHNMLKEQRYINLALRQQDYRKGRQVLPGHPKPDHCKAVGQFMQHLKQDVDKADPPLDMAHPQDARLSAGPGLPSCFNGVIFWLSCLPSLSD